MVVNRDTGFITFILTLVFAYNFANADILITSIVLNTNMFQMKYISFLVGLLTSIVGIGMYRFWGEVIYNIKKVKK